MSYTLILDGRRVKYKMRNKDQVIIFLLSELNARTTKSTEIIWPDGESTSYKGWD